MMPGPGNVVEPFLPTTSYPPSSRGPKHRHILLAVTRARPLTYVAVLVLAVFLLYQASLVKLKSSAYLWSDSRADADPIQGGTISPDSTLGDCASPDEPWSSDRLQRMVAQTRGYYARDYSVWLGWNNMRYIIEAGLLQAGLLNRTLLIPSYVYSRQCEFVPEVCAAFAEMVNRGDAIGTDEWRWRPINEQLGWKIPIGTMLDLNHLRKTHAVMTVTEYFTIHSLPLDIERGNGQWDDVAYHTRSRPISNGLWDPPGIIRVDELGPSFVLNSSNPVYVEAYTARDMVKIQIETMMEERKQTVMDWEQARLVLQDMNVGVEEDHDLELFLRAAGYEVLYTFRGYRGTEFTKDVVTPIKQIARQSELRGLKDDYGSWSDDIVRLEGEVHLDRKPGGMRFTNSANLQEFMRMVLHNVRSLPELSALGRRIDQRMRKRTGGRMWRAAHVRRGDFVRYTWSDANMHQHIQKVKHQLERAQTVWETIRQNQDPKPFDIPDAHLNPAMIEGDIPRNDDPFYIATDERDPAALDYIRSQGGVLIMDLLHPEDRVIVGWPLLVTDILAIAEQHVMARAGFFYGSGLSSLAGGVLNLRATLGWDPRTSVVE